MTTNDPRRDALQDLIDQAGQEAVRQGSVPPVRASGASRAPWLRWIVAGATVLAAIHTADLASRRWREPAADAAARDLAIVVQAAGRSVEAVRGQTGRLPEALPNPAHANLVRYKVTDGAYALSASVLGLRVTLQPDGTTKTEPEPQP